MLQILGATLAAYATWSIGRGEVCAREGLWARNVQRDERPRAYWSAVACWFAVGAALLFFP